MHIGMVYGEPRGYPPDVRVDKELRALAPDGHRVTLLARRVGDRPAREVLLGGAVTVVREPVTRQAAWRRAAAQARLIAPEWLAPLERFVARERPDALHVHDLLLVPTALRVAEGHGIPVVADLHENMPAALRAYRHGAPPATRLKAALWFPYPLLRWHEARALARCARVIVVVPEAAERLLAGGLPAERIVVVSNTEEPSFCPDPPDPPDPPAGEPWIVTYVGGVGPHRGLGTVLAALPRAVARIPGLRLGVIGATPDQQGEILATARALGVEASVQVLGWQPFDRVAEHIAASAACLVPHEDFEHTQTTVPHKLFQYMLCARPVVVSDCRPLARIVGETGAGLIFRAGDPADLARQLAALHADPAAAAQMGARGRAAALGPYAWHHDAERLRALYRDLAAAPTPHAPPELAPA